jgi:hypothetical protein
VRLLSVLLLGLAAYRLTRLVVRDTFPPVLWLRDRLVGGWRPLTTPESDLWWAGAPHHADHPDAGVDHPTLGTVKNVQGVNSRYVRRVSWSPHWLAELLSCPWCASAYVSGALTALTDVTYGLPAPWLVGLAVWAFSALLASQEWA